MTVSMYTLSTCPWCMKAKNYFRERNIDFDYVDYDLASADEQTRIIDEMAARGGTGAFPFVRVNGQTVVGYDPEKYDRLLGEA